MRSNLIYIGFLTICLSISINAFSQYDPAGGEVGSLAVHREDAALAQWPLSAKIILGPQDISNPSLGLADMGAEADVLGAADNSYLSLGDGGEVTLYFNPPILNQDGFDFAVFENGFSWGDSYFLELAFVEVSSDGKHFVRFPVKSAADTITQIENLAYMQPQWYFNLAGKHQAPYGTPFDLATLPASDSLDINKISHVRIIDVVGSLNDSFATRDSRGIKINDPWPTGFFSSGFDLDAVGVISGSVGVQSISSKNAHIQNPVSAGSSVKMKDIIWFDQNGKVVNTAPNCTPLMPGIYLVKQQNELLNTFYKICVTP